MRKNPAHMLYRVFHTVNTTLNNPGEKGWTGRYYKCPEIAKVTED